MVKHLNIMIFGRVIGVGFRWSTVEMAGKLDIKGFIENVDEDHINIEAEGEEKDLREFLKWCHKGPLWAKVERVEVAEGEIKNFKDFSVAG